MWPFSKSNTEPTIEKDGLINATKSWEEKAREENEQRIKDIRTLICEIAEQEPEIDFNMMRVVSIERLWYDVEIQGTKHTVGTTLVGHIMNEYNDEGRIKTSEIREWYLHCSKDHHAKLVKEFKDYIKRRDDGKIRSW